MVHLCIHHRVDDYSRRKMVFDETLEWRRKMGEVSPRFRQVDAGSVRPGS